MTETIALTCVVFALMLLCAFLAWSHTRTVQLFDLHLSQQRQAHVEAVAHIVALKSPEAARASAATAQAGLASNVAAMMQREAQAQAAANEEELLGL